jgi:hypothetical protein
MALLYQMTTVTTDLDGKSRISLTLATPESPSIRRELILTRVEAFFSGSVGHLKKSLEFDLLM